MFLFGLAMVGMEHCASKEDNKTTLTVYRIYQQTAWSLETQQEHKRSVRKAD
jgi:hypothetical protein